MPLLSDPTLPSEVPIRPPHARRQSQHSAIARSAIMSRHVGAKGDGPNSNGHERTMNNTLLAPIKPVPGKPIGVESKLAVDHRSLISGVRKDGAGSGGTSPVSTAPSSPRMYVSLPELLFICTKFSGSDELTIYLQPTYNSRHTWLDQIQGISRWKNIL